ncbi:hypothetical protein CALVIDRAFT_537422, partial [Calocera viscosa TUFC12733]
MKLCYSTLLVSTLASVLVAAAPIPDTTELQLEARHVLDDPGHGPVIRPIDLIHGASGHGTRDLGIDEDFDLAARRFGPAPKPIFHGASGHGTRDLGIDADVDLSARRFGPAPKPIFHGASGHGTRDVGIDAEFDL